MRKQPDPFVSIDTNELSKVAGGAARVAASAGGGANTQLMTMLQQIGTSIQDMTKNSSGGMDPMMMMMMMMMMGGGGGGGGGGYPMAAGYSPQTPTYVQVTSDGGFGGGGGGGFGGGCMGW